jgi:hypothetical protein
MTDNISENVSQKKRGRPRGFGSQMIELSGFAHTVDGGHRTKVNWVFMLQALRLVRNASEDVQRIVWGCTADDIESGNARFPKGWTTYAPEIGRFLIEIDDDDDRADVLNVIVEARQRGLSWSDIGEHYRTLRLGEKTRNEDALTKALLRVVHEFRKRFPKTPEHVFVNAAARVNAALAAEDYDDHHEYHERRDRLLGAPPGLGPSGR